MANEVRTVYLKRVQARRAIPHPPAQHPLEKPPGKAQPRASPTGNTGPACRLPSRPQQLASSRQAKPDMVAYSKLSAEPQYALDRANRRHGHPPGVAVGTRLEGRGEAAILGVHRQILRGIDFLAKDPLGAYCICIGGGYKDDEDKGGLVWYTGDGGQDGSKRQVKDQAMVNGNAALVRRGPACVSLWGVGGAPGGCAPRGAGGGAAVLLTRPRRAARAQQRNLESKTPVRVLRGLPDDKANQADRKEKGGRIYVYEGLYEASQRTLGGQTPDGHPPQRTPPPPPPHPRLPRPRRCRRCVGCRLRTVRWSTSGPSSG